MLTDDPAVRKQVDDMIFDFYGEENPRQLEEYQKTPKQGMTMGGIRVMDRKMVNFIKEQYPPGTRIRLNSMEDPYHPILPGTEGEVDFVDDEGQIFMKWDNGRTLPLIPGEDSFTVLPPKLTTLKLYMPLTADLYERNEYGDFDDSSTLLEGGELRGYQDQITAALVKNRMPEETERGIMHWYDEADSVNRKVPSAVFTVEERDRQLWGVAECRVAGELSDTEMDTLKEFITGQASDGWGEGFEQREISVDDGGELYVHFWNSDEWSIQTDRAFPPAGGGTAGTVLLHAPRNRRASSASSAVRAATTTVIEHGRSHA